MARGDADICSDIDLMFIVKPGKIYTTRFVISMLLYATGLKRGSKALSAQGKFCPNYYITSDYLLVPTGRGEVMDGYCAGNYSKSVLLAGNKRIFIKFLEKNRENWKKYIKKTKKQETRNKQCLNLRSQIYDTCYFIRDTFPVSAPRSLIFIRSSLEKILSSRAGDWLEKVLRSIQLAKINSDPRTKKYPDLIVANDRELRFHPPSLKLQRAGPSKSHGSYTQIKRG
jgi:hypothetical protein